MEKEMICPICGGKLANAGREPAANVKMEYQGDSQAIVRYYECSKCGRDFEIYDPTKEKRESDYKEYWNK